MNTILPNIVSFNALDILIKMNLSYLLNQYLDSVLSTCIILNDTQQERSIHLDSNRKKDPKQQ